MQAIYEPKGAAREYAALACNLYKGCVHGCRYCYAPSTTWRKPEDFHASVEPRPGILDAMRKDAAKLSGTDDAVLLCFTSDPYQPEGESVTRQALEILRDNRIPAHVLTKGGTRAVDDFDLLALDPRNAFGTTLVFSEETGRKQWEPKAAPIADRILAIEEAHALGIHTWVSVEPVIVPDQALWLIDNLSHIVDEWRVGKLNHHAAAKEVDWHRWAPLLLGAVRASGRAYLMKDSMRPYLTERQWTQERKREIERATA